MDILLPFTFDWFRVCPFLSLSPLLPFSRLIVSQYVFTEQGFDPYNFINGTRSKQQSPPRALPPVHPLACDFPLIIHASLHPLRH